MNSIIMMALWIVGFIASIAFLITSIIRYKNNGKSKTPIIISGIAVLLFGIPVALIAVLMIGLSTGLVGM